MKALKASEIANFVINNPYWSRADRLGYYYILSIDNGVLTNDINTFGLSVTGFVPWPWWDVDWEEFPGAFCVLENQAFQDFVWMLCFKLHVSGYRIDDDRATFPRGTYIAPPAGKRNPR